MARQKGFIKLKVTMGGITFYKSIDCYIAREKGGIEASRIANDPAFVRTRENGAEFGNAAMAGKLLRDTVRALSMNTADSRVTSRLTKTMAKVKNFDTTSVRGERNVATGLATAGGKQLLKGFNFNIRSLLSGVLFKTFDTIPATGEITIPILYPKNDLSIPQGATHVIFKSALAIVDFATGNSVMTVSTPTRLPADGIDQEEVNVIPPTPPAMSGIKFSLFCIEFVQSVNGADYPLKNGAFNVMNIVEVV